LIPAAAVLGLVFGLWGEHAVAASLIRRGLWRAKAAVLGEGAAARAMAARLRAHPEWGLDPMGLIADGRPAGAEPSSEMPSDDMSSGISSDISWPVLGM